MYYEHVPLYVLNLTFPEIITLCFKSDILQGSYSVFQIWHSAGFILNVLNLTFRGITTQHFKSDILRGSYSVFECDIPRSSYSVF